MSTCSRLAPTDPRVSITTGSGGLPSDVTLTLDTPIPLPAGKAVRFPDAARVGKAAATALAALSEHAAASLQARIDFVAIQSHGDLLPQELRRLYHIAAGRKLIARQRPGENASQIVVCAGQRYDKQCGNVYFEFR